MLRFTSFAAALLAAVTATAAPSFDDLAGQGIGSLDAERLRPGMSRESILDVEAATVGHHLEIDLGLQLGYAHNPITATFSSANGSSTSAVVGHRVGGHLIGALSLHERVQVGVDIPVVVFQSGDATIPGLKGVNTVAVAGLADMRLMPKVALLRSQDGSPVDVAVIGHLTLPSAFPRHRYIGDGLPTFAPEVAVSRDHGELRWAVNAGARLRASSTLGTATQGTELGARAAVGWDFTQAPLGVEASLNGNLPVVVAAGTSGSTPVEALVGAHVDVDDVRFFAAAGSGAGGIGAPLFRVLAGARWSPRCNDDDGDGLCADVDACDGAAEDIDGHDDGDGCPDVDNDGDGLLDAEDACPDVAGPAPGCPLPPVVAAPAPVVEPVVAPVLDGDNDGVADDVDACPTEAGPDSGCPVRLSLAGAVAFETGSARLQPAMLAELTTLVDKMRTATRPLRVTIAGHTDDVGNAEHNVSLSQRRAEAVKQMLVSLGLDAATVTATGFGAAQPVADNATDEGRQRNRRVEIVVDEAR